MNRTNTETVKDLMPRTPDLNAERLAKLKELFPDLFTDEGNLKEVELKKLVDPKSVNETERYEFRWFGKSNAKRKAFTPPTATLNYDAERIVNPNIIRTAHEVSASADEKDAYSVRGSNLRGLGFKVFKLESSYFPRTEWNPDPEKNEAENVQSLKDYIAAKESQLRIDFDHDKLLTEILLKDGFKLNYTAKPFKIRTAHEVSANHEEDSITAVRGSDKSEEDSITAVRGSDKNEILHVSDADKEALVCLDNTIATETVEYFKTNKDLKFICLERGLNTTQKWNLANSLGEKFKAI